MCMGMLLHRLPTTHGHKGGYFIWIKYNLEKEVGLIMSDHSNYQSQQVNQEEVIKYLLNQITGLNLQVAVLQTKLSETSRNLKSYEEKYSPPKGESKGGS